MVCFNLLERFLYFQYSLSKFPAKNKYYNNTHRYFVLFNFLFVSNILDIFMLYYMLENYYNKNNVAFKFKISLKKPCLNYKKMAEYI